MSQADLCHWLLDRVIPKSKIDRKATKTLLDLYK